MKLNRAKMRYKIAKFCAYTPFVLYALEFFTKSFEFGIFVWFALIVLSVGGLLFSVLAWANKECRFFSKEFFFSLLHFVMVFIWYFFLQMYIYSA